MQRIWTLFAVVALLWATSAVTAYAVTAPADTVIANTATGTFTGGDGKLRPAMSNTVSARVSLQPGLLLQSDQSLLGTPGQWITFNHSLTNNGNGSADYTFQYTPAGDYSFSRLEIFADLNGNGLFDTQDALLPVSAAPAAKAERAIASGSAITLAAGERLPIVIRAQIPPTATPGQQAQLDLTAFSGGRSALNRDSAKVTTAPVIQVLKSAGGETASAGGLLSYSLSATNSGMTAAAPLAVTIDGAAATAVLVRDTLPANTRFVSFDAKGNGQALYHINGEAEHSYVSVEPLDLTKVDGVALALAELRPNDEGRIAFTVRISDNAAGALRNTAHFHYDDNGTPNAVASNEVVTPLPPKEPVIAYFGGPDFRSTTAITKLGEPLYVGADAAACNNDATVVEVRTIIITSANTQDSEQFTATETGANTGVFRVTPTAEPDYVPTADVDKVGGAVPGNHVLETTQNDTLTARIDGCGSTVVETRVLVDPAGVAFGTCNNQPVGGVQVALVNAVSGEPAQVFQLDAVTPAPSLLTTAADGSYEFPLVAPGVYRLVVTPPTGFAFPSNTPLSQMPVGRVIAIPGSFGGEFPVNQQTGAVFIDLPLDCNALGVLFLHKQASTANAAIGEVVTYTVSVDNTGAVPLDTVTVDDRLPLGFHYLPGSARLNDAALADPTGSPGPDLQFSLGTIAAGASVTLSYRVRVEAIAMDGDGINRASAQGRDNVANFTRLSNTDQATVTVRPDVFSDEAYLIGKVYADCNRDRIQNPEELGIPGVRLYLEDGTWVVTDSEGKYSLYGLRPQTHVLKVDPTTLPRGAALITLDNRHAGDPASRFVDLRRGEIHRADFAEGSCSEEVMAQVRLRRTKGPVLVAERYLIEELPLDLSQPLQENVRPGPASGVVNPDRKTGFEPVEPEPLDALNSNLPEPPRSAVPAQPDAGPLQELATGFGDNRLAILEPADGAILADARPTLRIKGPMAADWRVLINGRPLGADRLGAEVLRPGLGLRLREYVAVPLDSGENRIAVQLVDTFGNPRGETQALVRVPGEPVRIELEVPPGGAVADGHTPMELSLRVLDSEGLTVPSRLALTLETDLGRLELKDLNTAEAGVQTFVEGGTLRFRVIPPESPGEARLKAYSGLVESEATLRFLPHLRELVMVGVVEGTLRLDRLGSGAIVSASRRDGFEQELKNFAWRSDDGETAVGARAALFLKGKVKGEYLLTAAYDSDKDVRERLFRDIRPDEFYPVYGDASVRGFDAQSVNRLYVRVDKDRSWALIGDYQTGSEASARQLGNYARSLNGARVHHETEGLKLDAFLSQDSTRQVVEEIRGQGISGPYRLGSADIIPNSEKVELVVRDRFQPAVVLETIPKQRFADYQFDFFSGGILFRNPVPSLDPNLNPVYVRVTYEVEQGGADFLVGGAGVQYQLSDTLELGAAAVADANPLARYDLQSVNATLRLPDGASLTAEAAASDSAAKGRDLAMRVEWVKNQGPLDVRVHALQAGESFDNPSAGVSPGRRELGAKGQYRLDERLSLNGELLHSESLLTTGGSRDVLHLQSVQSLPDNLELRLGLRHTQDSETPLAQSVGGSFDQTSLTSRLGWQPESLTALSVYGEYEQDLGESANHLLAAGGDYQLGERTRAYARHEFASSLTGGYGLNSAVSQYATVAGIDSAVSRHGKVFSEYRVRDAISGPDAEVALGVRNGWELEPGVAVDAGFERVESLDGDRTNDATALTGGIAWSADPLWKASARLELRISPYEDSVLNTLGLARKLDRDWTFLGRNQLYLSDRTTGRTLRDRLQLGVAYRDTDTNVWNGLGRYELRHEELADTDSVRRTHILSAHANRAILDSMYVGGRFATKYVNERYADGFTNDYNAHVIGARYLWDFRERWDFNLNGSVLLGDNGKDVKHGLGAELGYLLAVNLWVSGGYNVFGYHDDDLAGTDYTDQGLYLRLRFKFDETYLQAPPR